MVRVAFVVAAEDGDAHLGADRAGVFAEGDGGAAGAGVRVEEEARGQAEPHFPRRFRVAGVFERGRSAEVGMGARLGGREREGGRFDARRGTGRTAGCAEKGEAEQQRQSGAAHPADRLAAAVLDDG